jgi:hemolysin activation/secretion protein
VLAQSPPAEVPSGIPPGAEPDVRLKRLEPGRLPPPRPEVEIPLTAPTRAPPGAEHQRFVLTRLEIAGMTAYPPEFFEPFYRDLLGTEVSLTQLYDLAGEIQRVYRADGYFLTRVIVVPQEIRNGEFRLEVIEGFIYEVRLEGDSGPGRVLVQASLRRVTEERPLRFSTLERGLLRANDVPGLSAVGVLRPSPHQVGAAELVVTLKRKAVR